MFEQYPDLLTVPELQDILQIGRYTAYQLVKDGAFPSVKIGRKIRVPKRGVVDYILRTCYDGGVVDGCACSTEVTV